MLMMQILNNLIFECLRDIHKLDQNKLDNNSENKPLSEWSSNFDGVRDSLDYSKWSPLLRSEYAYTHVSTKMTYPPNLNSLF